MRGRIRKKLHKRYLIDVVSDISQSPWWRQRLFAAEVGQQLAIANPTNEEIPAFLQKILRRYRLSYQVAKVPHSQTKGWFGYEDCVMFRFEATEFPTVHDFSANNPKV